METGCYKVRSLADDAGAVSCLDLDLELEEGRAYVVLDSIPVGKFRFKARMEIDPALLERINKGPFDFAYRGTLVLPRPQHN